MKDASENANSIVLEMSQIPGTFIVPCSFVKFDRIFFGDAMIYRNGEGGSKHL
jgi:hypothetical protein